MTSDTECLALLTADDTDGEAIACSYTAAVVAACDDGGEDAASACKLEGAPGAAECEFHTIKSTIPANAKVCTDLRTGKFERYSVHEFDQIYLEEDPDVWTIGASDPAFDCDRFKDLLPSVYTYCTNMKVWGDTAAWERSLKMIKPNKDRIKVRKGTAASETKDEIYASLQKTLPLKENKCGRVVTAHNDSSLAIISNKGGNCVPFETLHEIMYRVEFETADADCGKVANPDLVYVESEATETSEVIYRDMFCGTEFAHTNSKFTFRQMSYLWDHIQGGSYKDPTVSSASLVTEFRPDGSHRAPVDYFTHETTTGAFPENQRYSLFNRSFCYIDWIGDFSGATSRYDSYGDEYVDPYLLYSREIEEAIWNTAIAISSKKKVYIDNLELWDVLEQQLTNPEDGNILSSLAHAATKHFMKVRSTDSDGEDAEADLDYIDYFNQE